MDPLFPALPENLSELTLEELTAFITASESQIEQVAGEPDSFVTEEHPRALLLTEMSDAVEALEAAREELAARETADEPEEEQEPESTDEELSVQMAQLAARARGDDPDPEPDPEPEPVEPETVTAAAELPEPPRKPGRLARSRAATPVERQPEQRRSLTAAAGASDLPLGYRFDGDEPDPRFPQFTRAEMEIAGAMIKARGRFGNIPKGTKGEQFAIAQADWRDLYPPDRTLSNDEMNDPQLVDSAISQREIRQEFTRRRDGMGKDLSLVASGGLCAPVTPYYQLMMVSVAERPVRAALPAFNADRGGVKYARPASLSAVTTGVAAITADYDRQGGTFATKACQTIDCPTFSETDVQIIYHCLQFGNLGARTFPERVAQWNNLVLAAHARLAESVLLTGIDAASTAVTATNIGLGATGALLGQILAAANGMRSRHRMDPETVLRLLIPDWALDLLVSDVIRGQFQRFDTDEERITALLRSFDIEPTFYIDGATGASQVFGAQAAGALLPFPSTVRWYLYPEGSFLYVDGGVLELGIVRDSVLNKTNDMQVFGESFENVAFIGVESLAVTSTICDSGVVAAPFAVDNCGNYARST